MTPAVSVLGYDYNIRPEEEKKEMKSEYQGTFLMVGPISPAVEVSLLGSRYLQACYR